MKNEKESIQKFIKERKIQREDFIDQIGEYNPNAILLEPRSMYDFAVDGYSLEGRVIYNYNMLISLLMEVDKMTEEDAREHFDYNIRGTFEGMENPNRPIFMFED